MGVHSKKYIRPVIFDGGNVINGGLSEELYVEVQPAYAKTQIVLTRSVIILTSWVLYLSIVTTVFEYGRTNSRNQSRRKSSGEEINMIRKKRTISNRNLKFAFYVGALLSLFPGLYHLFMQNWTFGFGYITIGVAAYALGFSIDIAEESDKKMIEIQNANFLEALSDFEYARMEFNIGRYEAGPFIWRSLSEVNRMAELDQSHIKQKHQWDFVSRFCGSLEVLLTNNNSWKNLERGIQENVIKMFIIILNYERLPDETKRLNELTEKMGRDTDESILDFINRLKTEHNIQMGE